MRIMNDKKIYYLKRLYFLKAINIMFQKIKPFVYSDIMLSNIEYHGVMLYHSYIETNDNDKIYYNSMNLVDLKKIYYICENYLSLEKIEYEI